MYTVLIATVLPAVVLGCAPTPGGSSVITATPKMRFTYSPPLIWTYSSNTTGIAPGQSISEAQAQSRINGDIEFAVIKALQQYGYSSSGISIDDVIVPEDVTVGTCADGAEYEAEEEAVAYECDGEKKKTFKIENTITVKSPLPLSGSQWESISIRVYSTLIANSGVKFHGLIKIV